MESYIRCTEVDYESTRVETYFDIQLNIKGKKDGMFLCNVLDLFAVAWELVNKNTCTHMRQANVRVS